MKYKLNRKIFHKILIVIIFFTILLNVITIVHAYKFTNFTDSQATKTKDPSKLGYLEKLMTLFMGVSLPRPINTNFPTYPYQIISLQSNKKIECWYMKTKVTKKSNGLIILFHGYQGEKSKLIDHADLMLKNGYDVLLVDFMGSGGSEGNQSTIGYFEADQVKTCYDYFYSKGQKNIFFYGVSMGAVAIMRAVSEFSLQPKGIILDCPFGSMYETTCARFKTMKVPSFPLAGALVFLGGAINGFWGFSHNPMEYAKNIKCPLLLFYGLNDEKVSLEETNSIYKNLQLKNIQKLFIIKNAGHENFLLKCKSEWETKVIPFLKK